MRENAPVPDGAGAFFFGGDSHDFGDSHVNSWKAVPTGLPIWGIKVTVPEMRIEAQMAETTYIEHQQQEIPELVLDELAHYEEQIKKYRAGELGEVKMQKLRLHFGTYAQR